MQSESARAEHHQVLAVAQPRAVQSPVNLRHCTVGRRGDDVRHIVRYAVEVLAGAHHVMRREGRNEMWRLVGMASAEDLVEARRLVAAHAVSAAVAYGVVDGRDAVAQLYRNSCPVGLDAVAERHDASAHLMAGHRAVAPAELAAPDVHLGAADVGLRHFGDDAASRRRGHVILVEVDFVSGGNKGDASLHGGCSCWFWRDRPKRGCVAILAHSWRPPGSDDDTTGARFLVGAEKWHFSPLYPQGRPPARISELFRCRKTSCRWRSSALMKQVLSRFLILEIMFPLPTYASGPSPTIGRGRRLGRG
jgi:hypothetical protein